MTSVFSKIVEAKPHTPVYTMHKYFARRPWNVFSELISHYTSTGDIILDPFCGGGVTVIESLKLRRKAIGVDVNPLATYITEMECRPLSIPSFERSLSSLIERVEPKITPLYRTKCAKCQSDAVADWIEWSEPKQQITRLRYQCLNCNSGGEKTPSLADRKLATDIGRNFDRYVREDKLWYPKSRIPHGDKTDSLIGKHINWFHELFTTRNLLALALLLKEIDRVEAGESRDFLKFVFSSSLKWASRQSHLRGHIVEGWAMHAYWIYPKSLEINVWNTFQRRAHAIIRGKTYSNERLGALSKPATAFAQLITDGAYLILNRNAANLPIPDNSVDAVVTDPPYGGNVNYAELSDYWYVWIADGKIVDKEDEVIINKTQQKRLEDYERLLRSVLEECYRVLKTDGYLVSTFNSKNVQVVASFVMAASGSGFSLHPQGLIYQNPIRPYTTTFHAMQIGASVGDFIFTFMKPRTSQAPIPGKNENIAGLKETLSKLVADAVNGGITDRQIREQAYRALIPFIAENARADPSACREATDFFQVKMREHETQFRQIRLEVTEKRKRKFQRQRVKSLSP